MPSLLGPVIGPPLSGLIVTYLSWRWIFFINLPIGLIAVVLITFLLKEVREEKVEPLDWRGFALAGLGLAALMFGFEASGRGELPFWLIATLVGSGTVLMVLYVAHARRTPAPILDLTLLHLPTFRASTMGGTLFRIASGAVPFLLPVMLQLGFGLSPLASGLITFATAIGALSMRLCAAPIVRFFGFRRVLLGNVVINTGFFFAMALFTPDTSHVLIFVVLLAAGFFRSLQLTAMNTMGYSDVAQPRMSRASSFASTVQQTSQTIGVGLGALILHVTMTMRGGQTLAAGDFWPAFVTIGCVAFSSIFVFWPLSREAGAEVSGHRAGGRRGAQPSEDQAPVA
jgi:MFS family permease